MPVSQDLIEAKRILSARLLAAGVEGLVHTRTRALTVAAAAASAGRNVHAVGVGSKIVEGKTTSTPCIRLFVVQKMAPSLLPVSDYLPAAIDGIPTDVIESPVAFAVPRARGKVAAGRPATLPAGASKRGARVAASAIVPAPCTDRRQSGQRPVVAGISTAHRDVTAGTLGYFCRSTRPGEDPSEVLVLSNNHIFANLNRAAVGDPLFQPGPLDEQEKGDPFAELVRAVPLNLDGATPNRVDAAVGRLLPGIDHLLEVCTIGRIDGCARAVEGTEVRKHGRTTGYAEGKVSDDPIDAIVAMDPQDPGKVGLFHDQMRIVPISPFAAIGKGGDSGSLVVTKSRAEAVGLYFANPETGEYGYASHIADVLDGLQIELL